MQPTQAPKASFNLSLPTKQQVLHGLERVAFIFVTITAGVWLKSPDPFSKAAIIGATFAGGTAVYQAILSLFTSL
jgi:hypothetical protein